MGSAPRSAPNAMLILRPPGRLTLWGMTQEQKWSGQWWLPGDDRNAHAGELVLSASEFVLTLTGAFHVPGPGPSQGGVLSGLFRAVQEPVIQGESRGGERITLLDCEGVVPQIPASMHESSWRPRAALIGGHFEDRGQVAFTGVRAQFDYLFDWAGGRLSRSYQLEQEGHRFTRAEFDLKSEVIGKADVEGASVELQVSRQWRIGDRKAEIDLWPFFQVRLAAPTGWQEIMRTWVRPLRDLVSFATLRGVRIEDVLLRSPFEDAAWIHLVLQWIDLGREDGTVRSLIPQDMLFTATTFPDGFEAGLPRWFEVHRKHSSVMDLVFGVDYAPFVYDEQRFLALVQAAEILHRTSFGGSRLPPDEHRRRVEAVVGALNSPDLAGWARPILQEANFLRLAERLDDLLARLGQLGHRISGGDEDLFVKRVKDTRNYLTHRDRKKDTVLEGSDRYWHGQAVLWILRTLLLQELGLSVAQIAGILGENIRFQWFEESIHKSPVNE
jgi:hypothetical protein